MCAINKNEVKRHWFHYRNSLEVGFIIAGAIITAIGLVCSFIRPGRYVGKYGEGDHLKWKGIAFCNR